MASHGGAATADLRAILESHCPDIVDEVLAAYEVARAVADGATSPGPDQAGQLRWAKLTLGQIPGVQQVADVASAPLDAVAAFLKVVAGLLDALTAFLLELPDPIRAMILAAYQILKDLIDDLLSSGAYLYTDAPGLTSWKETVADLGDPPTWKAGDPVAPSPFVGAFEGWASTFRASFDDPGDQARPVFSEGATVEAVFIMATAPGMPQLAPLLRILDSLFDIGRFREIIDGAELPGFGDLGAEDPDDWRVRGAPTGPNWRAWRIADIAPPDYPLRELERIPELLKALLLNVDGIIALLKELIAAVRAKIDVLLELAETIQRIIEMIQALTASGLHVLVVVSHDGVDGLVQAFLDAEDRPGRDGDGKEVPGLVIGGCCLLAGTSTALALGPAMLWQLLGVDGAFDEAHAALEDDWKGHAATFEAHGAKLDDAYDRMVERAEVVTGAYDEEIQAQREALETALNEIGPSFGMGPDAIAAALDDFRDDLLQQVEEAGAAGLVPISPLIAAEIEASRAARQRGRRSLALRPPEAR
jgi:hypothetical protein